jgi:hypothetical protein
MRTRFRVRSAECGVRNVEREEKEEDEDEDEEEDEDNAEADLM